MAKKCMITGKGAQTGNNVSHANNKTKRRFLPNLQKRTFLSECLGRVELRVSVHGMRTVEKVGGLDAYLMKTPAGKLTDECRTLRRRLEKAETKRGKLETKKAA